MRTVRRLVTVRGLLGLLVALLAFGMALDVPGGGRAEAGRGLRARVYLVQRALPRRGSERALLRFARAHHSSRLRETNESDPRDRKWEANLVVHFDRPPGDLEFHVLFYDTQDGAPRFVDDMAVYLNSREQRTYVQRLVLPRPKFKPERRMELVVTVGRKEVARRSFQLRGERRGNTGEVAFSEEEVRHGVGEEREERRATAPEPAPEPIPEPIPEAEEEVDVDPDAVGSAEDMALPEAPPGSETPPAVSPSAAGRRGGLCSVGGVPSGEPAGGLLGGLALALVLRRRGRAERLHPRGVRGAGLLG